MLGDPSGASGTVSVQVLAGFFCDLGGESSLKLFTVAQHRCRPAWIGMACPPECSACALTQWMRTGIGMNHECMMELTDVLQTAQRDHGAWVYVYVGYVG